MKSLESVHINKYISKKYVYAEIHIIYMSQIDQDIISRSRSGGMY